MPADKEDPKMLLKAWDIYKELRLRGYDYGKTFQGILESNNAGNSPQMHLKLCTSKIKNHDLPNPKLYMFWFFSQVTVENFTGRVTG